MKRRNFIQTTSAGVIAPSLFGKFGVAFHNSNFFNPVINSAGDNVLVIIQLNGGNDGLNTLVPYDKWSDLMNARPNVMLNESDLLDLYGTDTWKFHPSMTGMRDMYNAGQICAIQSVGYDQHSGSHATATDAWLNGKASQPDYFTGWAGRYLETIYSGFPDMSNPPSSLPDHPPAIEIGSTQSLAFMGQYNSMGVLIPSINKHFRDWWWDMQNGQVDGSYSSIADPDFIPSTFNQQYCGAIDKLDYLRTTNSLVENFIPSIYNAYNNVFPTSPDEWDNSLTQQLSIVAKLIAGGLKTKLYLVRHDGYDTHGNQLALHSNLLSTLSGAVKSFQDEINSYGIGDRVMGMTISEFGRTISDHGSDGTDHGTSSSMFLFGNAVRGGVHGISPTIPSTFVSNEDDQLTKQFDVRDIYNTILKNWFCVDQSTINDDVLLTQYNNNSPFGEPNVLHNSMCNDCEPTKTINGIVADGTYHAGNDVISDAAVPAGVVDYKAGQEIMLQPGFSVEQGACFSAEIEICTPQ